VASVTHLFISVGVDMFIIIVFKRIIHVKKVQIGDSSRDSTEGSSQVELR